MLLHKELLIHSEMASWSLNSYMGGIKSFAVVILHIDINKKKKGTENRDGTFTMGIILVFIKN